MDNARPETWSRTALASAGGWAATGSLASGSSGFWAMGPTPISARRRLRRHFRTSRFSIESDWFATVRGRIGYAMDRGLIFNVPTLWYVTAGAAWAGLKAESYIPGGVRTSDEQTASGWTVGWGSENAIDDRWSFKTETLYIDYGKDTFFTPADPVSSGEFQTDTTEWVTRIGVTYKLSNW